MPYGADRVKDATTSTGTGAVTLTGSTIAGFQAFAAAFGSPTKIAYVIDDGVSSWEVGEGTFDGVSSLTRDLVRTSSNGNALVSFGSGTKSVYQARGTAGLRGSNYGIHLAFNYGWALP